MKIVAIIGSSRKNGNSFAMVEALLSSTRQSGIETEILFLCDYTIRACTGCEGCSKGWDCIIRDDFASIIHKLDAADGIILASPTYWYSVTSDMKRFIDRSYSLVQYPDNRREWVGKYHQSGKLCLTAAVCEQPDESMMGNTLSLLSAFARDIGLEVVDSVRALGFFEAGRIRENPGLLESLKQTGTSFIGRLNAMDPADRKP